MGQPPKRTVKIVAASLVVLTLVWQRVQATRLGYAVERTRREAAVLKGRVGTLQRELQTSLSPAELAWLAQTKLGMSPAGPESLRIMEKPTLERPEGTLLGRWLPRARGRLRNT